MLPSKIDQQVESEKLAMAKLFTYFGGGLMLLFSIIGMIIIYFLIISPLIEFKTGMDEDKKSSMFSLQKLDQIYNNYQQVKNKKDRYDRLLKNNKGVSTLIEENAKKAGILGNKTSNQDSQANIQNKFRRITSRV